MSREFREVAAFDVDDVLLQHAQGVCDMSNELFGTTFALCDYQDNWPRWWGVTPAEAEARRLEMTSRGLFEDMLPIPGAKEALTELRAAGIGLAAVTRRRISLREVTQASLDTHFSGMFSSISFATYFEGDHKIVLPKSELCLAMGANSLTDDQYETCLEVAAAGLRALHFGDYNWAEPEERHPRIARARNWREVGRHFDGQS